jgi:hypothetical protein
MFNFLLPATGSNAHQLMVFNQWRTQKTPSLLMSVQQALMTYFSTLSFLKVVKGIQGEY